MTNNTKRYLMTIDKDLHMSCKIMAMHQGCTLRSWITQALAEKLYRDQQILDEHESQEKKKVEEQQKKEMGII